MKLLSAVTNSIMRVLNVLDIVTSSVEDIAITVQQGTAGARKDAIFDARIEDAQRSVKIKKTIADLKATNPDLDLSDLDSI